MELEDGKMIVESRNHDHRGHLGRYFFAPSLGRLIVYMLVAEGIFLLSEQFQWFPLNAHKGWTVLIALASMVMFFVFLFLSCIVRQLCRRRFQFSLLSLLAIVIVVAFPCSWLVLEIQAARKQAESVNKLEAYSMVGYEWQVEANGHVRRQLETNKIINISPPPSRRMCDLLGVDFFSDVVLADFDYAGVTDDKFNPIQYLTQLQWLGLREAKITDDGLRYIKGLKQLKRLDIDYTEISDSGLKYVKDLNNLKWLNACDTPITDVGLQYLRGLTQIKALEISKNQITDAGLKHLKGLTNLQILMLCDTKVTDAGLKNLTGLRKLKVLTLSDTQVTDAGLKYLTDLTGLEELWLENTNVTDAGLDALNGLVKLKCLKLTGSKTTNEGIEKLRKALPKCCINQPTDYWSSPGTQYEIW